MEFTSLEDFVLIVDDFMDEGYCENVIDIFDKCKEVGITEHRSDSEGAFPLNKDDYQLFSESYLHTTSFGQIHKPFFSKFWGQAYPFYGQKYASLQNADRQSCTTLKIQKTPIGGGYHEWHYESSSVQEAKRVSTFILYLNDVEEGGETELLYFPKRIQPKKNRLVLFPAGFTHTHRGNPPISNDKYILTGWVEY